MIRDHRLRLFEDLYDGIGGYNLSLSGRGDMSYHDTSYTYGEIVPESFVRMLSQASPKAGEVFYDLGSGTGKAVILADMYFDFASAKGIEYIGPLHQAASEVLREYQRRRSGQAPAPQVEFVHGDFLETPYEDADIVFAHATCFHEGIMLELARRLEKLKKGARFISVSRHLDSPYFSLQHSKDYSFTWGAATVHTYYKTI